MTVPDSTHVPIACPICGNPAEDLRLRPFCSKRCADVDLGRWFTGAYRVPGEALDADVEDSANVEDS